MDTRSFTPTPRENWPDWLKNADTEDAVVTIEGGYVFWHAGTWRAGTWHAGAWLDGTWLDGTWLDGTWRAGVWRGGVWLDGEWHGGEWLDGEWHGGESIPGRAGWTTLIHDDLDTISVGCQSRSVFGWRAVLDGAAPPPDEAPQRDSQAWHLQAAALHAAIAYAEYAARHRDAFVQAKPSEEEGA